MHGLAAPQLDELILATKEARNELIAIEDQDEKTIERLKGEEKKRANAKSK